MRSSDKRSSAAPDSPASLPGPGAEAPASGSDLRAAAPPIIDPDAFEQFEGWRETTLAVVTDAKANATLRAMADLIYTIALEYSRYWPVEPDGCRHQCRAAVADLRHLQGYLSMLGEVREDRISTACRRLSHRVKSVADALEAELAKLDTEEEE